MEAIYEYRLPGRRPATVFGFGAAGGLLAIAATGGAPWYIWAIWGSSASGLIWALAVNPVSGFRIDQTHLSWFTLTRSEQIPLADISRVELAGWSDGPDSCRIVLANGESHEPPDPCLPPGRTLQSVLAARGITVTRS